MTSPNYRFELNLDDIELIEMCLSEHLRTLSERRWTQPNEHAKIDAESKSVQELLGKIHNQKIWYRPERKPYVSG